MKNKKFFLHTIYGKGFIRYEVFSDYGFKNEVPLSSISGTMAGKTEVVFNGMEDSLTAVVVEYEKDDYKNNIGFYDSLDETVSTRIDESRRGKLFRFIPRKLLQVDPDTGKVKNFKDFGLDFIGVESLNDEIVISKVDIDQKKYNDSFQADLTQILPNVGLSPVTFGKFLGGTEGKDINSDKEKLSIKTRKELINNH